MEVKEHRTYKTPPSLRVSVYIFALQDSNDFLE